MAIVSPPKKQSKHCPRCDETLPIIAFSPLTRGGVHWICRRCDREKKRVENGHKPRGTRDLMTRLREKIIIDPVTECWEWQGYRLPSGYGTLHIGSRTDGTRKNVRAHRLMYELTYGSIPSDLVIDHLCRNPCCINPEHLEPVTNAENLRRGVGFVGQNVRKTHCPKGHLYAGDNLYIHPDGSRRCRQCHRDYERSKYHAKTRV